MFVSKLEEPDCEDELEEELLEEPEEPVATGDGTLELPPPPPPQEVRIRSRKKENIMLNLKEI